MTFPIKYLSDGSDGRLRRSARTRKALIEAYLDLLRENQQPPIAAEIAKRAGVSTRSVFERFTDILTLSFAAADYAFEQTMAQAAVPNLDADLHTRLKSQVETRAAICEQWLPLWRALLRYQSLATYGSMPSGACCKPPPVIRHTQIRWPRVSGP